MDQLLKDRSEIINEMNKISKYIIKTIEEHSTSDNSDESIIKELNEAQEKFETLNATINNLNKEIEISIKNNK